MKSKTVTLVFFLTTFVYQVSYAALVQNKGPYKNGDKISFIETFRSATDTVVITADADLYLKDIKTAYWSKETIPVGESWKFASKNDLLGFSTRYDVSKRFIHYDSEHHSIISSFENRSEVKYNIASLWVLIAFAFFAKFVLANGGAFFKLPQPAALIFAYTSILSSVTGILAYTYLTTYSILSGDTGFNTVGSFAVSVVFALFIAHIVGLIRFFDRKRYSLVGYFWAKAARSNRQWVLFGMLTVLGALGLMVFVIQSNLLTGTLWISGIAVVAVWASSRQKPQLVIETTK